MRGMWTTEQDGAGEHRGQGEGRCTGPGSSGGNTEWGREVGRVCDIQGPMRREFAGVSRRAAGQGLCQHGGKQASVHMPPLQRCEMLWNP